MVNGCLGRYALDELLALDLVAPSLLWSEASSVLHGLRWRGLISPGLAAAALERLLTAGVTRVDDRELLVEAWDVADRLGWAKTYDAQYVALARRRDCPLVTLDDRLSRGAGRLVRVLGPGDL